MKKLYEIEYRIQDGENQYSDNRLIYAKDSKEAKNKALKFISDFWGKGTIKEKDGNFLIFYSSNRERAIQLIGVSETTKDLFVKNYMMYDD